MYNNTQGRSRARGLKPFGEMNNKTNRAYLTYTYRKCRASVSD